MKIGQSLKRYEDKLYDLIFKYAYENYNMQPLMELVDVPWFGEIFEVSNMDQELHTDLIDDLKDKGAYWSIKKEFDKFVILPDVFSVRKYPLYKERNEYDQDRRQIVFVNNYVLELKQYYFKYYRYCHNGKCYYFYKDSEEVGDMFTKGNHIQVLNMYDMAYMYDHMAWNWWEEERLHINIDKNNKLIFIVAGNLGIGRLSYNAYLGAGATATEYIGMAPMAPYIEFDYEENTPDPTIVPYIPGLTSFTPDNSIMEPLYGVDEFDNYTFFHSREVLLSKTILIVYKDASYYIDNVHKTNGQGKIVRKIDKHTIVLPKDETISKIIVFTRPFNFKDYDRIDSVYDAAMKQQTHAFLAMEKHKKYTNTLYDLMVNNKPSLEQLIDYGYKYDRDVLKVIQNFFKVVNEIDLTDNFEIIDTFKGKKLPAPMILIRSLNRLDLRPVVFINDRMIMSDLSIHNGYDVDEILIDTEELLKIKYPNFRIDNANDRKNKSDLEWIKKELNNYIECIHVAYVALDELNPNDDRYGVQPGRLLRLPVYRGELVYDNYSDFDPSNNGNRYKGVQFVNGRLNATEFTFDSNNIATNKLLFRTLDGIETFDFDNGIRTFKVATTTTQSDIYNPVHKLSNNKYSIFRNDYDMTLLINRTDEKLIGLSKVNLGYDRFTLTYNTNQSYETVTPVKSVLKERSTLVFDKFGILANDQISVLSDHYVNLVQAYNYQHFDELSDDIVLHGFALQLKNPFNGTDLEIDENLIGELNVGSFNESCMSDPDVRGLFNPNVPSELRRAIPVSLKPLDQLLGEKILTRYYLGPKENAYDKALFAQEVEVLNGRWINTDGTLGIIPEINKDFIEKNDKYDVFTYSLNYKLCSNNLLYKTLLASGLTPSNGAYVITGAYIDQNKEYVVNMNTKVEHYLKEYQNKTIGVSISFDINDRDL